MLEFDVIVIGTGGGAKLIRPAANLGLSVAVIEHGKMGGTCLNFGCIPSKMLVHPADLIRDIEEGRRVNIVGRVPEIDFAALVSRTTETIEKDASLIGPAYAAHPKITVFEGTGRFTGPSELEVNGQRLRGKRIFVSAGVRPRIPSIPGLADTPYLTHKEALRLTKKPRSITIIGGGFIAVELGHFFSACGVRVTILSRSELLKEYDADIRSEFLQEFGNTITVNDNCTFERVDYENGTFTATVKQNGQRFTTHSDQLLVASGMVPNSDILNVAAAGIEMDASGNIVVDDHLRTSADAVWAFGDIIGAPYFRHKANFEGEYLFRTVFEVPADESIKYPPMPWAFFSYPQIAGFGPSEAELAAQGIPVVIGKAAYKDSGMGMAYRSQYGFVKLIFGARNRKLLSAFVLGPNAATMAHMPLAFAHMNATLDDMLNTIYIHPALPEIVRNAARKAAAEFKKGL